MPFCSLSEAWRGVPSHFNTATALDAGLYAVKLAGAAALSAACLALLAGVVLQPRASAPRRLAIQHGTPEQRGVSGRALASETRLQT